MPTQNVDVLIVGAGPAGLQLSSELVALGRDHLVLERGPSAGMFFESFPRHRQLISINKPHTGSVDPEQNLRMDWNSLLCDDPELRFTGYTPRYFPAADDMVRYLRDFATRRGLPIRVDSEVVRISRRDEPPHRFAVQLADGARLNATTVVIATGVSRPYVPDIPGIELVEQYVDMSVDPADFTDQRVLVLGKGNSAFETADNLLEQAAVIHVCGPGALRLAWQSHFVGHLRAVNNNFLDSYQLKSQNAILDGELRSIATHPDGGLVATVAFSRADDELRDIRYDRILCATGFRFDASILDESCRPALVHRDRFPVMDEAFGAPGVPGLYFAGTITQQRDFKHSTNGFIHGFRYGARALARILQQRDLGRPWPGSPLEAEPDEIADAIIDRINRTSALWQQFGVLADVVRLTGDPTATYLREVPVDHARAGGVGDGDLLLVTLEYGPDHDRIDPFDISARRVRQDDPGQALDAAYLHPVIRHVRGSATVAEHHLAENLENEWDKPAVHRNPLRAFLADVLAPLEVAA